MGRVARYKKIKAIDPFNTKTHGVIDLEKGKVRNDAPKGAHQPLPRAFRQLMQVKRSVEGGPRAKVGPQRAFAHIVEQPGETAASFRRRLNAAHNKLRLEAPARAPTQVSAKRKRFLERQKLRKRGGGGGGGGSDEEGGAAGGSGSGSGSGGGARAAPGGAAAPAAAPAPSLADLTFEGSRRGALRLAAAGDQSGEGNAHALPFATRLSEYSVALLPADLRRAKRKREEAGGLVGLDAWEGPQAPAFGERVEAPPKLTFAPRSAAERKGAAAAAAAAATAAAGAFGMPGAKKARREAEAQKAAALRVRQMEDARDAAVAAFKALKERRRAAMQAGAGGGGGAAAGEVRRGAITAASSGAQ
jgi:hypothetical protein